MIVGFSGTRDELTDIQKDFIISYLKELKSPCIVVHGDCIGADDFFGKTAHELGHYVVIRPGFNSYGKTPHRAYSYSDKAYPVEDYLARNRKIVNESDVILAAPKDLVEQSLGGTWYTIRYAKKKNKPIEIIYPE